MALSPKWLKVAKRATEVEAHTAGRYYGEGKLSSRLDHSQTHLGKLYSDIPIRQQVPVAQLVKLLCESLSYWIIPHYSPHKKSKFLTYL
jgi:hypothetical protein